MRDPRLIKSAVHVADLMSVFESPSEILSQREIVKRTKLSRGIVHRLLYTLEPRGVIEKVGNDQYRLAYRRLVKKKWKIGYGLPGVDTLFTTQVMESLRAAADRSGEIELLMRDHRYKAPVTLRDAEEFVRQRVHLMIEYQLDEQVASMIASKYRDANIPMIAINYPHPGATYFGANNYAAGLMGGRRLGKWARSAWAGEVEELVMLERSRSGCRTEREAHRNRTGHSRDARRCGRSRAGDLSGRRRSGRGKLVGDAQTLADRGKRQNANRRDERRLRSRSATSV